MAECEDCKQEMLHSKTCDFDMIRINGKTYKRNT